jgi:hypothetical protein
MGRFLVVAAVVAALLVAAVAAVAQAEPGPESTLTAISGQGTGHVLVAPTAEDRPNFAVQVEVNVRDLLPNSTYTVQRAPDLNPDGVCTGTTWLSNGPVTTSQDGTGAAHFFVERGAPFVSGVRFDVVFRLIGNGAELRSHCMTVTVK